MTERIISYAKQDKEDPISSFVTTSSSLPLSNGQEFLVRENSLILPSQSSEALISLPSLDTGSYEYPYYVNTEGFIVGPRKIGKHAWLVGGQENKVGTIPLNANTLLVGNILIDPGSHEGIPYLLENLSQLGKDMDDIELVLITHAHLDHMEAIDDLQMLGLVAPVIVPEKSVERITYADVKKIGMDMYEHEFHPFRIDGTISDSESLKASGFTVRAQWVPGHAGDHMYYVLEDDEGFRTFVVGDLLLGGERKEFGYDRNAWENSLARFGSDVREEDEIFAGHHPTSLHMNEAMKNCIKGFGKQHWDLIPGQPGMLMSPWPY